MIDQLLWVVGMLVEAMAILLLLKVVIVMMWQ
jgi:hypothetical protein